LGAEHKAPFNQRKVKILANEKSIEEIRKLFDREKDIVLKIQGAILKGTRLDELYLYGGELVNVALQIQYHCARISLSVSQEIPEKDG
jgi:hypothetical protein